MATRYEFGDVLLPVAEDLASAIRPSESRESDGFSKTTSNG